MKTDNYKIYDNFGRLLKDFDIVAVSTTSCGVYECALGIYFKIAVVTWDDFTNRNRKTSHLVIRKNILFNKDNGTVDRSKVEIGELPGEYILKTAIKITEHSEETVFLRNNILKQLENGNIGNNVSRKSVSDILKAAKLEGIL